MLHEISKCEVCHSQDLDPVLDLGLHPMCDDLVEADSERVCKTYPIEILYCDTCKTAHQKYQIPKQELFPTNYHYRARHTADVIAGMRELVESCASTISNGIKDKKVLDIGCNDGSLLSIFKEQGCDTFGIEPTGAAKDAIASGHNVINEFFTPSVAEIFLEKNGKPDVITFTNVFAHIEDLQAVISGLKTLIKEDTHIVIENHYLGAVIDRFQFDTFYHEHPRTYSYRSFEYIANALGMTIVKAEFPERYNGNIRIHLSADTLLPKNSELINISEREESFGKALKDMAKQIDDWKISKKQEIVEAVKKYGKLKAKAFPGRAAIPLHLLQLNEDLIECIYEKPTSAKINHYAPGTRIKIVSDDDFNSSEYPQDKPLLNLAWHIEKEIRNYLSNNMGFKGPVINIIQSDNA